MRESRHSTGEDEFFNELRFWSQTKLRILGKYIDAYLRKRGSSHFRFYYVDGFAGSGHYGRRGGPVEAGSPVRLAQFAQEIKDTEKPYRLVCINTERNRKRCQLLQEAVAAFDPELVHVLCGSFRSRLPEILGSMGRSPAVCFLDPFGVIGMSPEDLRPLLERPDTEFLLNLNTRVLRRLSGSAVSEAKAARGKVNLLSHTLGDDPREDVPEWMHMRDILNSEEWIAWAIDRYQRQLQAINPSLRYAAAYPIREKHQGEVKYHLVFASRSPHAFPIMSDFICAEEDDLKFRAELASRARGQMGLFPPAYETEREEQMIGLLDDIHQYGLNHQGSSREEIIRHFSFVRFGEFKQKHYRQMLNQLVKEGRAQFGVGTPDDAPITFQLVDPR